MSGKFEVLTGREQILKRPQMWIGSMDLISEKMFLLKENSIEYETITYIPALKKIIDEILDNALDALILRDKGIIKVFISTDKIIISDNGPGIPVVKKELTQEESNNLSKEEAKKISIQYLPEIAWTRLFSGSNFEDSFDKITIGAHGLGSKCASIFSTKFIGHTDDGKLSCTVTTLDNLSDVSSKIKRSSGKTGTTVEFYPDLKRFGLAEIEPIYLSLIKQRLVSLSLIFQNIQFYFNNEKIFSNAKKTLELFSPNIIVKAFDKGFIGIFSNNSDEFNYFSYVNGLYLKRGGTHIDYISDQLVQPIREKLVKKYKTIKPADIKNKLSLVVFFKSFPNLKTDSQTKDTLTNSTKEVADFLSDIDFLKLSKEILKNESIMDPIIEAFKLKEDVKNRVALKQTKKKLKIDPEKYMPPTGNSLRYLALCEGASARSGISASLGRDGIGYYAMRGLPLNAYSSNMTKISANQELKDIINILNLNISTLGDKTILFDKILITSDNDADGSHIVAMLLGWFKRFAPNLYKEKKICRLITPLIICVDNKNNIKEFFFNTDTFKIWEEKNKNSKLKIIYLKGLGSWDKEQLIGLIDKYGLDYFIQSYELDSDGEILLDDWLSDNSEPRKKYLRKFTLDINAI